MPIRSTHTYAELELSQSAYDEIKAKLKAAEYDHAFLENGIIDMHGIGVSAEKTSIQHGVHVLFGLATVLRRWIGEESNIWKPDTFLAQLQELGLDVVRVRPETYIEKQARIGIESVNKDENYAKVTET